MIGKIIRMGLVFAAAGYMMWQVRKPSRWLGRLIVSDMNRRHSTLTDWGLGHIAIGTHDTILDVGCGGGRTINKLANAAPLGKVYGIDYARGSIAASQAYNQQLIAEGRVTIQHAGSAPSEPSPNPPHKFVAPVSRPAVVGVSRPPQAAE